MQAVQSIPQTPNWQTVDLLEPVPQLEHVPQQEDTTFPNTCYNGPSMENVLEESKAFNREAKLVVIGHRGCGKNKISTFGGSPDPRPTIRENTITSFTMAARNGADFIEFDVQVTKDGCVIVFHDDYIIAEDEDGAVSKRIGELSLEEFLTIGHQKDASKAGKTLLRKAVDGTLSTWKVTVEDSLCTLQEVFEQVPLSVGFDIELKFDDGIFIPEYELQRTIRAILKVVESYAMDRKLFFSSFHPDAVRMLRTEQFIYPVFFLTDGGINIYNDPRRNSIEAAIDVCRTGGLQGIVSEVKAILQNPEAVSLVKQAGLSLVTYGDLNNMPEALHKQEELGVDGVCVDHVLEMVTESRKSNKEMESAEGGIKTAEPTVSLKAFA